jgi:hypothetical protein
MQVAPKTDRMFDTSSIAIFLPERNKPLHVVLNGANLGSCCGAVSLVCPETNPK